MAKQNRREMMESRAKKLREGGGNYKYFIIPKDKKLRVRFPQIVDDQEFCQEILFFFLSKEAGSVVSAQTFGEPCPIFEMYEKLKNSADDDDKELANRIKPKKRFMGPCYRFNDEAGKELDEEQGVKLIQLTTGLYQSMIDMFLDEEKGDFTDPVEGFDLKFNKTGQGLGTEYHVLDCKPSKIKAKFRKEVYNPEEMVRELIPTYEEAEVILNTFMGVGASDDEEDEKPRKKKSTTGTKKKKKKPSKDL